MFVFDSDHAQLRFHANRVHLQMPVLHSGLSDRADAHEGSEIDVPFWLQRG